MHNAEILFCVVQALRCKNVTVLQAEVVFLVKEAFPLHTGHIKNIQLRHDGFKVGRLNIWNVICLKNLFFHITRQFKLFRRNQDKSDPLIAAERGNQGMHRTAEFQVTANPDCKIAEAPLLPVDRQQIGKCLRGVVVSAVPRIDHRDGSIYRSYQRRTFLGMAHGDNIRVAGDNLCCIRNTLPLGGRGALRLGEADYRSAELKHCSFKAEPCAGRWFEKQRCDFLAAAELTVSGRICDNIIRSIHELLQLFYRKVLNGYKTAFHAFPPIQLSSEGLSRKRSSRSTSSGRI